MADKQIPAERFAFLQKQKDHRDLQVCAIQEITAGNYEAAAEIVAKLKAFKWGQA